LPIDAEKKLHENIGILIGALKKANESNDLASAQDIKSRQQTSSGNKIRNGLDKLDYYTNNFIWNFYTNNGKVEFVVSDDPICHHKKNTDEQIILMTLHPYLLLIGVHKSYLPQYNNYIISIPEIGVHNCNVIVTSKASAFIIYKHKSDDIFNMVKKHLSTDRYTERSLNELFYVPYTKRI
jgi:hypothetical protein